MAEERNYTESKRGMLRAVTLENFIWLKERQELKFEGGTYLFIGENGSGKSSVLEAIRRCLSVRVNTAFSTIGEPNNDSYVVCKYEHDGPGSTLFACQFYLGENEKKKQNKSRYKLAALLDQNNEVRKFGIDFALEAGKGSGLYNCSVKLEGNDEDILREAIRKDLSADERAVADVLSLLRHHHNKIPPPSSRQDNTKCESILSELGETFVFLFENRGISPLQIADSRKRAREWRYQHRVQIIKLFLDDLSEKEQERAKEIFNTITDNLGLEFQIEKEEDCPHKKAKSDDDVLVEKSSVTRSTQTHEYESLGAKVMVKEGEVICDVLKTPEGLLEAKQCSLMLAKTDFRTICLEDPGRGMHPQMLHRFRDIVLLNPMLESKTILITTHNPISLAPWTVPKTFIFRRKHDGKCITQKIIPGSRLLENEDLKTPRFLTSGELPLLFFAQKVMFVEGDNDLKFMTALKYKILLGADEIREILKQISTDEGSLGKEQSISKEDFEKELSQLKQFMSALDIIQMMGETHKERLRKICSTLDLDFFFLLDKNAVVIDEGQEECFKLLDVEKAFDYKTKFPDRPEVNSSNWNSIRDEFYRHGIYVWKNGDLEDMVIEIPCEPQLTADGKISELDMHKRLKEQNHIVSLDNYKKKKQRAKFKLYSSKKLTDANIKRGMKIMLQKCVGQSNDLVNFIAFLRKCAKGELHRKT